MNNSKVTTTNYDSQYHDRQFQTPYQSTIKFWEWLIKLGVISPEKSSNICDLGCGKGANLYHFSKKFPRSKFIGLDIDEQLIIEGSSILSALSVPNVQLSIGDLYNSGSMFNKGEFDGVISLQTLSWLPEYKKAIDAMISLAPQWIALSSLFFDGPIEAKTIISEYDLSSTSEYDLSPAGGGGGGEEIEAHYYNTYSLPLIRKYFHEKNYSKFDCTRFEIPIDLPKPLHGRMQTYTEETKDGRRLQISGPLLMNWYFICASKE